jgi:release factor glutamine methyltransferase
LKSAVVPSRVLDYLCPVTVLEIIQRSSEYLEKRGVDSPRLNSELMLAHILKSERLRLYLDFNKSLSEPEIQSMRAAVKRRGNREPLQHILGSACFCGLDLKVSPAVLVPRPETEELAELGWKFLNDFASPTPTFLDFATGSGCIAVALVKNCSRATGIASDKSPEAIAIARENAIAHGVAGRIRFIEGEGLAYLPHDSRFDLVISNPPYIPMGDIVGLQREVREFEPRMALDGGPGGLDFYLMLAVEARPLLKPGGKLMIEFGDGQAEAISKIFQDHNWIVEKILPDYSKRLRMLCACLNEAALGSL